MSVCVWCELVCARCSITSEGMFSSGRLPKRELIKSIKSRGWIVERDEVFCSRYCRDQYHKDIAA